jgi:hypothetical protein
MSREVNLNMVAVKLDLVDPSFARWAFSIDDANAGPIKPG